MPLVCSPERFAQMFTIELPAGSIERLGTRLWDDYLIEVPLIRWNDREFMRISIQAYNSVEDVQRLEEALSILLRIDHRQ
jgi:selenocysteine lyase/cysteine desulfurase